MGERDLNFPSMGVKGKGRAGQEGVIAPSSPKKSSPPPPIPLYIDFFLVKFSFLVNFLLYFFLLYLFYIIIIINTLLIIFMSKFIPTNNKDRDNIFYMR